MLLTYLGENDLHPSDGELALLVVAFDLAQLRAARGSALLDPSGLLQERMAEAVVDLVLSGGMRDPWQVAAATLRRIGRHPS